MAMLVARTIGLVALLAAGAAVVSASHPRAAIVKVEGVGELACSVMNDGTLEGLGIPFAAAPVGQNRFRPPQPPHYTGSRINATAYGPACLQNSTTIGEMSEDCLTLNIWSPASRAHALLPVFFWIHGGGFVEGSGKQFNGSHLAKLGVVVVSINYRLGALGWFASDEIAKENPSAPGNGAVHGFLDQVVALRWVRQHIAAFGGDENLITIGGESAGSLSTCVHLHLPASKDLFRRAIMESGSCVAGSPWGVWNATYQQINSKTFTISVNATDLASLRHVPAAALLNSPLFAAFGPSADGWYMHRNPAELPVLTKGLDIIVGANTMDSIYAPPWIHNNLPPTPDLTPKTSSAFKALMNDYFGSAVFDVYPTPAVSANPKDVAHEFWGMSGDVCNQCPKHFAAQKFLASVETVFVYEFGFAKAPLKGLACHGCEISDVFNFTSDNNKHLSQVFDASYTARLGDAMSRYWASFIKHGHPGGDPVWPKYKGSIRTANSLKIAIGSAGDPRISVARGLDARKCEFFEQFMAASDDNWQKYFQFCFSPVPLSSGDVQSTIVI